MKLLAVDDDPLILELLDTLITQIGTHELITATSAEEAIELISEHSENQFNSIFLDIQMPGTDGIELCKMIRAHPCYTRTPVLMITSMSDKKHIDAAFLAGATDYLTKPFEISELRGRLQIIESLVDAARAKTVKLFATTAMKNKVRQDELEAESEIGLYDSVPIDGVTGVVEYHALENYVAQISRKSLFGSSVLALKICEFEFLHQKLSSLDLGFAITDVAEAISDALEGSTFLLAYAGNGIFACVVEGGWQPDPRKLSIRSDRILERMDLHDSRGTPLRIELYSGPAIRLISRIGARAVDALSEAQEETEKGYKKSLQNPMNELFGVG